MYPFLYLPLFNNTFKMKITVSPRATVKTVSIRYILEIILTPKLALALEAHYQLQDVIICSAASKDPVPRNKISKTQAVSKPTTEPLLSNRNINTRRTHTAKELQVADALLALFNNTTPATMPATVSHLNSLDYQAANILLALSKNVPIPKERKIGASNGPEKPRQSAIKPMKKATPTKINKPEKMATRRSLRSRSVKTP